MIKLEAPEFLLFSRKNQIIDVRSPAEFEAGHIPNAINIPLFSNFERAEVGVTYKQKGRRQALQLGFEFTCRKLVKLVDQCAKINYHSYLLLHCWRGGMRSESFAWLLNLAGLSTAVLKGGYKNYRNYLLQQLADVSNILLLGGHTGTGKTEMLHALKAKGEQVLDLEKLACHKGSVFGGIGQSPQPTTEQFQNNLFNEIRKFNLSKRIWIENENSVIGKVAIPETFWKNMIKGSIIQVTRPLEDRVKRLVVEYGKLEHREIEIAVRKIERKLGNQNMKKAIFELDRGNLHKTVDLLLNYYDKAYNDSFEKRKKNCLFTISSTKEDPNHIADKVLNKLEVSFVV